MNVRRSALADDPHGQMESVGANPLAPATYDDPVPPL
jgi:hypothetical protein